MKNPLAAAVLAGSLVAAPAAYANPEADPDADAYVLDPTHTFAFWEVNHLGLSNFTGRFNRTEGSIRFSPEERSGAVDITIHVDSVNSGVADLDEHLLGEDFFRAEEYPTIRFTGDEFHFDGERLVAVGGELTILGTTQPVQLQFTSFNCVEHPMTRTQACGGNAVAHIQRSHFGMDYGIPAVSDAVRITIEVEAFVEPPDAEEAAG